MTNNCVNYPSLWQTFAFMVDLCDKKLLLKNYFLTK